MNKIVREHYPVEKLPDDLKEMLAGAQHVHLVMEIADADKENADVFDDTFAPPDRVMSLEELFALRRPPYRTTEEIVADIRQQRDEWDD